MLKVKLKYFVHLMQRTDSLEKTMILGKTEGRRRRGRQRMSGWMACLTWWTWVWVGSGCRTGMPGVLQSMGSERVEYGWATEQQQSQARSCVVVYIVAQSRTTLCAPMDCSPPDSSVCGILQAIILKWVAVPFSRGSSRPRDRTCISCLLHWQVGSLPLTQLGTCVWLFVHTHTHTHTHTHSLKCFSCINSFNSSIWFRRQEL